MRLVGPRPLLMQYLDRYTPEQARRHEVRPGITGWAQVNGRNALSWEEKFALDVWYVDHVSLQPGLGDPAAHRRRRAPPHGHQRCRRGDDGRVPRHIGRSHPLGKRRASAKFLCSMGSNQRLLRVLILGAGGHAQVVADVVLSMARPARRSTMAGFLDDDARLWGSRIFDAPVLGPIDAEPSCPFDALVVGIGSNTVRRTVAAALAGAGRHLHHARSPVSRRCTGCPARSRHRPLRRRRRQYRQPHRRPRHSEHCLQCGSPQRDR